MCVLWIFHWILFKVILRNFMLALLLQPNHPASTDIFPFFLKKTKTIFFPPLYSCYVMPYAPHSTSDSKPFFFLLPWDYMLFVFWLHCTACGILVPWPGSQPAPTALEVRSWASGLPGKYALSPLLLRCSWPHPCAFQISVSSASKWMQDRCSHRCYTLPWINTVEFACFSVCVCV